MTERMTVEQVKERHRVSSSQGVILSPDEAGVYIVMSQRLLCMPHLVRWIHHWPEGRRTYQLQCGNMLFSGAIELKVEDEFFCCKRCIEAAEKHGDPTHNLVPTTGCETSEGKRKGRPKSQDHGVLS